MLVAWRLAGLSALEGHYAGLDALSQQAHAAMAVGHPANQRRSWPLRRTQARWRDGNAAQSSLFEDWAGYLVAADLLSAVRRWNLRLGIISWPPKKWRWPTTLAVPPRRASASVLRRLLARRDRA
jgi:hypothetical protein